MPKGGSDGTVKMFAVRTIKSGTGQIETDYEKTASLNTSFWKLCLTLELKCNSFALQTTELTLCRSVASSVRTPDSSFIKYICSKRFFFFSSLTRSVTCSSRKSIFSDFLALSRCTLIIFSNRALRSQSLVPPAAPPPDPAGARLCWLSVWGDDRVGEGDSCSSASWNWINLQFYFHIKSRQTHKMSWNARNWNCLELA